MSTRKIEQQAKIFINRLEELDAADRARLKRNAGQSLGEARHETLGLFYSLLPRDVHHQQEDIYFLAATLFPLADGGGRGNLGASLKEARNDKNAAGLDRRVKHLLDADEGQLPFRMRQAIRFLQSNRVGVDWPCLLEDLMYWSHPERWVQRRWARAYYSELAFKK
jgi:CRISPR system Cascade subunit CasB